MKNGDNERVVEARPVRVPPRPLMYPPTPVARGAGPGADQEDFALREWLRCSFGMCMSDRDREVVREAVRERIRPVEEAGKMLEWDWGSERLAVAESCLPSRVAEARRLVAQELWVVGWDRGSVWVPAPPSSADGPLHPSRTGHVVPTIAVVGSLVM